MDGRPAQGFDLHTVDTLEAEVEDVARALDRLAEGSYGTCEVCGTALDASVLAERPAARHCSAHLPIALG